MRRWRAWRRRSRPSAPCRRSRRIRSGSSSGGAPRTFDNCSAHAPVLRKSMGELAQRPSLVAHTAAVPADASRVLREYLERASRSRLLPAGFDVTAAATLLAGVLFADALSRDLMPDEFPGPEAQAPRKYVRLVLDGIHHAKCPIRRHAPPRHGQLRSPLSWGRGPSGDLIVPGVLTDSGPAPRGRERGRFLARPSAEVFSLSSALIGR